MTHLTSASKADLLLACQHWLAPRWRNLTSEVGVAAHRGSVVHLLAEHAVIGGTSELPRAVLDSAESEIAKHRLDMSTDMSEFLDDLAFAVPIQRADLRTEVAFVYDPFTDSAAELDVSGRDYGELPENVIPGTFDLIAVTDQLAYVGDYKTSYPGSETPAGRNGQLGVGHLVLRALYGSRPVKLAQILHCGEPDGNRTGWGIVSVDSAELDDSFLDSLRNSLCHALTKARNGGGDPVEGPHCTAKFCVAYGHCAATDEKANRLIPASTLLQRSRPLTLAQLPAALDAVHAAEAVIKAFKANITAAADLTGEARLDLGDGRTYQKIPATKREYFDYDRLREVLTPEQLAEVTYHKEVPPQWRAYGRKKSPYRPLTPKKETQ